MVTSKLSGSTAKFLLRLAARLSVIYFLLRAMAPPTFSSLIDTRNIDSTIPWWIPIWPIDQVFWAQPAYGAGAPLLVLALTFALFGILGLRKSIISKKEFRYLTTAAAGAMGLLLFTGLVFTFFAFPNLQSGSAPEIFSQWHVPLLIFFTGVSVATSSIMAALALVLVKNGRLALWAGLALALGMIIVNANWFTLFFNPQSGPPAFLVYLIGIGWSIGLWYLGYVVNGEPATSRWPKLPSWRKMAKGAAWLFAIWVVLFIGVFAWDARGSDELCPGTQQISSSADGKTQVIQDGQDYSFTYTNSPDLTWKGGKYNAPDEAKDDCSLRSFKTPQWVNNRAMSLLPFYTSYWLYQTFGPGDPEVWAYAGVRVSDAQFDTIDGILADIERQEEFNKELEARGKRSFSGNRPEIEYVRSTLDNHDALLTISTYNGANSNTHGKNFQILNDGHEYTIYWSVASSSIEKRDAFIDKHGTELDEMLRSFRLKNDVEDEAGEKDVREVVWEQLSSEQKERVDGTWEDGAVSTVTLNGVMMIGVEDKSYEGKEVYMIVFPTKDRINLPALADMDTFDLIGFAPAD